MQIENNKEEVPFSHYEEQFKALEPAEAVSRTGVKWDGGEFYVNLLGREYAIAHPDYSIRALDGGVLPRCLPRLSCSGICWKQKKQPGAANGRPSGKCPGVSCISSPIPAGC